MASILAPGGLAPAAAGERAVQSLQSSAAAAGAAPLSKNRRGLARRARTTQAAASSSARLARGISTQQSLLLQHRRPLAPSSAFRGSGKSTGSRTVSTLGGPATSSFDDADGGGAAAGDAASPSSPRALASPDLERLVAAAAASPAGARAGLLSTLPFEFPDELSPLADALTAATARSGDAAAVRDALEAEAQEVAQLSVDARDAASAARARAEAAGAELAAASKARDAVAAEIEQAISRLEETSKTPLPVGDAVDPADAVRSSLALSRSRLVEREGAVITAREKAEAAGARAATADAAAARADDVAGAAMAAAEAAVRDEMEAAAVAKETSKALAKALGDLQELGLSFEGAAAGEAARQEAVRRKKEAGVVDAAAAAAAAASAAAAAAAAAPAASAAAPVSLSSSSSSSSSFSSSSAVPASVAAAAASLAGKAAAAAGGASLSSQDDRSALSSSSGPAPSSSSSKSAVLSPDSFVEGASGSGIHSLRKRLQTRRALLAAAFAAVLLAAALTAGSVGAADALASALEPAADAARSLLAAAGSALATAKAALPPVPHGTEGLIETIWLLATSVVLVPLVSRLPGGSPVLGFLVGGALIGPHAFGIIRDVEGVRHLAELGVVFLLFNIGLELSLERLRSMQKFVFGMGSAQVVATLAAIYAAVSLSGAAPGGALSLAGPAAAVILGGGLALSSTAVAMQVLQDRGESGSRHGRATFAVLLLQDLAVVVLLMLIPLLAPGGDGSSGGGAAIARALGLAAVKAVACIVTIMAGGRAIVRPFYRRIADTGNADVFAATTLLVVLGTSVLTQLAGLSLALGAFLAGLLLAETEFALQVESDIAPYKGLLMGLFFMTVGMEISVGLFFARMRVIVGGIALLLAGKAAVMAAVGPMFGLSRLVAARAGLLLASGGEFAFVAFGEAQAAGILPAPVVQELFLVVALTMALTPLLAELGSRAGKAFGSTDMKALAPSEGEAGALRGHVIIAGFGRVGQIIAQLLAERLIPFVAVDVRVDRVQSGKDLDLPVYFGDAGSAAVLHSLGAEHAACAVITLDTPGANYRSVWALNKHFPHVKTYVRAHDVDHGLNLEKAGATAVVPETLEPSLQLASAVLSELSMPPEEVQAAIAAFRKSHLAELQAMSKTAGQEAGGKERFSLGYGYTVDDDDEGAVGVPSSFAEGGGNDSSGGMPSPVPA